MAGYPKKHDVIPGTAYLSLKTLGRQLEPSLTEDADRPGAIDVPNLVHITSFRG